MPLAGVLPGRRCWGYSAGRAQGAVGAPTAAAPTAATAAITTTTATAAVPPGAPPHNGCVVSAWTPTTPCAKSCGTTHAATWERKVMRAPPGAGAAA